MEKLFELWGGRSPKWEIKYEALINKFADYGKGTNSFSEDRAKIYGAGYEIYIIAFFIGLYFNRQKPLNKDKSKIKDFGWAIQNWGNIERRNGRSPYGKIREYIFAALVARTEIDFLELDKGDLSARKAVDALIKTMEDYANYGFDYLDEKLEDNPNYFYKDAAFLREFLQFFMSNDEISTDEEPESLDAPENLEEVDDIEIPEVDEAAMKAAMEDIQEADTSSKVSSRWTTSEIKELKELRRAGLDTTQLAQYFRREKSSVEEQLSKYGL